MSAAVVQSCRDGKTDIDAATRRIIYFAEKGVREVESTRSLLTASQAKSLKAEYEWVAEGLRAHGRRNVEALLRMWRQCGKHVAPRKPSAEDKALRRRAESVIPVRKYIGTLTLDTLSPEEREGHSDPRWNTAFAGALFWCDGKRTLAEVIELSENEHGRELLNLVPVFEFMAAKGLLELKERKA